MSQTNATQLMSKLRYNVRERRNLKNVRGPQGRHDKIRKVVTALFKHERIELNYNRGDESRGYAERLISDAIKYGECHKSTMEMASYWLLEPQLVHKLFKVLVPRYQNSTLSYTKMWRAPRVYPGRAEISKCVLELRNNIYPPLGPDKSDNKNLIHNVLLQAAKRAYEKEKAEKLGKNANDKVKQEESAVLDISAKLAGDDAKVTEEIKVMNVENEIDSGESNVSLKEATDPADSSIKENEVKAVESKLNKLTLDTNVISNNETNSESEPNKDLKTKDEDENLKN